MKGVPPEIDALMWRLAEDGGAVAQAEFEARHARYGPELSRRIRMVAELRQAGKTVCHRPTFTPRPVRTAPAPRWAVGSAVGLAILAVGAVAYVAASGGERPASIPPTPKIETSPARVPDSVVQKAPEVRPAPVVSPPEDPGPAPVAERDKLRDVRIADTSLAAAIELVAAGGGFKATVAPGFPDQKVSLDYRELSSLDMLKAMGERYGFSVLEEGEGEVLIVPARPAEIDRRVGP